MVWIIVNDDDAAIRKQTRGQFKVVERMPFSVQPVDTE